MVELGFELDFFWHYNLYFFFEKLTLSFVLQSLHASLEFKTYTWNSTC